MKPAKPAGALLPASGERQCKAKSKRSGERCKAWAVRGASVCRMHGGAARQVRAAGEQRRLVSRIEADAKAELAHYGISGGFDPLEVLEKTAREVEGMKDALARRVNALTEVRYTAGAGEQLRAEITLYERALDRTVKVAEILARLDLEGRKVQAREKYAAEIVGLIQNVLDDLALSERQWALIPQVMARRLAQGLETPPAQLEARPVELDADESEADDDD